MGQVVPDCEVTFAEGASPDTRNYRVSCDRFAAATGFQPRWTARDGATELYEAYRRIGTSLEEFEGPRYQRIAHIRGQLATGALDATLRRAPAPTTAQPES